MISSNRRLYLSRFSICLDFPFICYTRSFSLLHYDDEFVIIVIIITIINFNFCIAIILPPSTIQRDIWNKLKLKMKRKKKPFQMDTVSPFNTNIRTNSWKKEEDGKY